IGILGFLGSSHFILRKLRGADGGFADLDVSGQPGERVQLHERLNYVGGGSVDRRVRNADQDNHGNGLRCAGQNRKLEIRGGDDRAAVVRALQGQGRGKVPARGRGNKVNSDLGGNQILVPRSVHQRLA